MKEETSDKVREEFERCVINTIKRRTKARKKSRPFHDRLLFNSIGASGVKTSAFERSFSTSFGQRAIEKISQLVASDFDGTEEVYRQKETIISLGNKTVSSIREHLRMLRENKLGRYPCWEDDIKDIDISGRKEGQGHRVISDLWFKRDGREYFFSIKTVEPNIDQTESAKKDMLKLKSSNPCFNVYFALPYNPFGDEQNDYSHNPPSKIFDMKRDEVVLIGREYWDLLGGYGTYKKILDIADDVGLSMRNIIREHLGL